jgi:hypothetical protein
VDANDNELAYLEAIHFFVEVLDQVFGNVCELDLVFNFYKVGITMSATTNNSGQEYTLMLPFRYMRYLTRSFLLARLKRLANKSF